MASKLAPTAPTTVTLNQKAAIQQQEDQKKIEEDLEWAAKGTLLRRVKKGKIKDLIKVSVDGKKYFNYYSSSLLCTLIPNSLKAVPITDLLEVRTGYSTDNLHNASKKYEFQESAPENVCFSVIFSHRKFLHKSVDFAADIVENRDRWVSVMSHLLSIAKQQRIQFSENAFITEKFKQADRNKNGTLSFDEIWQLLKKMNLQLSENYARAIFNESEIAATHDGTLNEKEFVRFFERLTDREELRLLMKQYSDEHVESWTVDDLQRFLVDVQKFPGVDRKKAESILDTFEPLQQENGKEKLMGLMGMRRLLNSRWGNILKPDHEHIFMDMDQPLPHYFCSSSHNTYLTGSQIKGVASVEGYISALKRGARLLELDIFDGEGFPVITHKRTLIEPISLKNALESIKRCAFDVSPYPVILTIENHASLVQQRLMAEYFTDVLGDMLYKPSRDSAKVPFPSPNQLKRKFILRGKKLLTSDEVNDNDDDDSPAEKESTVKKIKPEKGEEDEKKNHSIDSKLSSLIALPAVKLSNNVYEDIKRHPMDGSPSLSENKVQTLYDANFPMHIYTATRFVKSYPKGIRQDSSNQNPMISWIGGLQGAALNFQTADEAVDINTGMFRINGNCGYVLKPKVLRDGLDPRSLTRPKMKLGIHVISAQYLPKSEPGKDIIDPYVTVHIHGIPIDEFRGRTPTIKDNGFNPTWDMGFEIMLCCPELALLRFAVKDFDSTTQNDFVGEYSLPVMSVREGYSQIRLNTGFQHTMDPSATLCIRVTIQNITDRHDDEGRVVIHRF